MPQMSPMNWIFIPMIPLIMFIIMKTLMNLSIGTKIITPTSKKMKKTPISW